MTIVAAVILAILALLAHDFIRARRVNYDTAELLRIVRDFNVLCESGNLRAASAKLRALANLIERSGS